VLDSDVLAGLAELGDPEFFAELVDDFVHSTVSYLAALREAVSTGDCEGVHRTAHTMKSSAANMGATRFSEMCRDLEAAGREGRLGGMEEAYELLRAHYEDVAAALTAEVAAASL